MRRAKVFAVILLIAASHAGPAAAAGCDGRYDGFVRVRGAQGLSIAPMQWTVREGRLYGAFEGPSGLFMVEATVDATCAISSGAANDYDTSAPMALVGSVTEGQFRHNGPVTVTYQMQRREQGD